MKRAFCLNLAAAVAVLFVGASLAFAQTGPATQPPVQGPTGLAGTEWVGQENLQQFGKLAFRFQDGQKVLMIDAHGQAQGSYTQNGPSVRIQFGDCVYEGTIQNKVLAGTARFTSGQSAGVTWNFAVQNQPSQGR
jgi:hypothetical protein